MSTGFEGKSELEDGLGALNTLRMMYLLRQKESITVTKTQIPRGKRAEMVTRKLC